LGLNDDQPLDAVNRQLLRELHADPRISMSALARRVGMSSPAVTERVQRLREIGVITGFAMNVDPGALGLPVTAFVRVRPSPGQLDKIAELARSLGQVTECHRITGEDCFLIKLHAPAVTELDTVLDQFLIYGQTTTSIVQSSPVPPRPLPVASEDQQVPRRPQATKRQNQTIGRNTRAPMVRRHSAR
jgi:Lrp/AsnC family transcriptional regulator, leucine-responsive regulatory protein